MLKRLINICKIALTQVRSDFPFLSPNVLRNTSDYNKSKGQQRGIRVSDGHVVGIHASKDYLVVNEHEPKSEEFAAIVNRLFESSNSFIDKETYITNNYLEESFDRINHLPPEEQKAANLEAARQRKCMLDMLTDSRINLYKGLLEVKTGDRNLDALLLHDPDRNLLNAAKQSMLRKIRSNHDQHQRYT